MIAERKRRLLVGGLGAVLAVGAVIGISVLHTVYFAPIGFGSDVVTVKIEPGSDLNKISSILHDAGLLSHQQSFRVVARLAGLERKLRSGDYEVHPSWTLMKLLEILASGRGRMLSVTLPEGVNLSQVADRLDAAGITPREDFLERARDREFLASLGIPGPTAEGFLFPETYHFSPSSRAEDVIVAMYRQFREVFESLKSQTPPNGLDDLGVVTLASLVEKETARPEERPIVAAVFYNRLRHKPRLRLQADPSVIYGIENFDGNLTRKDLRTYSPYNTYIIQGLPPGPISNPGRGSLWASLKPADVDYLYFVSRNDGSHHFSRSLAEHESAVRRYQLAGRRK